MMIQEKNRSNLKRKNIFHYSFLILVIVLGTMTSSSLSSQTRPSDEEIMIHIQNYIRNADSTVRYSFLSIMGQPRNFRMNSTDIVKIGEFKEKPGVSYWPVRARVSGSFIIVSPLDKLMGASHDRIYFDTTADFRIITNDFGEIDVDFLNYKMTRHHKKKTNSKSQSTKKKTRPRSKKNIPSSPTKSESLVEIFRKIPSLKGETTHGKTRYPFILHVKAVNKVTGKWTGTLEWTSMNSIHRVEGTVSNNQLIFKGTEYVKRGKIMLKSKYTLNRKNGNNHLSGFYAWKWNQNAGKVRLDLK